MTRGTGKVSGAIARITSGPFSHAALVLNTRWLFESDDIGVGMSPIKTHRVEQHDLTAKPLSKLEDCDAAVLLRYPNSTVAHMDESGQVFFNAVQPFDGFQYPEWWKLGGAIGASGPVCDIATWTLAVVDKFSDDPPINPGPFCSQLVCAVWSDVFGDRLPLFTPPVAPEEVNPNMLLDSALRPVDGLVCHADPSADVTLEALEQFQKHDPRPDRRGYTGVSVDRKLSILEMQAAAAKIGAENLQLRHLINLWLTRLEETP